jgi:polysaccharide biosynthesis protein PslH
MQILFLSRWFPYPANNGSKLRILNLLRGLANKHTVTLISFFEPVEGEPDIAGLKEICQNVHIVPWHEFDPSSLRALRGFLGVRPRSVVDTYSKEMSVVFHQTLQAGQFDLVIASQIDMATYAVEQDRLPILLEEAELGVYAQKALQAPSLKSRIRNGLTWWKYRVFLQGLFRKIAASTVVSEQEKQLLQSSVPNAAKVLVVPNCMKLQDYEGVSALARPNSLIYTGSFRYYVNHDAMVWFIGEVFPIILARCPQTELIITGDPAGQPLPSSAHVEQTGVVEDIRPWVAAARVALAPLQTGGGTRLKILEAMALHTPVVSTSKGAEGLDAQAGVHLLVADSPRDFADAVVRLLQDDRLYQTLAEAGYDLVQQKYNWDVAIPGFLQLVEETVQNAHSRHASGR